MRVRSTPRRLRDGRVMPRARPRSRARAGAPAVPPQRSPGTAVLVLLTVTEPMSAAVRRGSEAARDEHMPVEIVVLAPEGTSSAACLATVDAAVGLARSIAPELEIRA